MTTEMEIRRVRTADLVPALQPNIEVREAANGMFVLALNLDDETTALEGPYPTAELAEREGIEHARLVGVRCLYVVRHVPV